MKSETPSYAPDLFSDAALREPEEHHRALRDLGPVVWLEAHQVYAVARYQEARSVLADAGTYCSGQGVALNDRANQIGAGRNLIMTDGALHTHLRKVLGGAITAKALRHLEDDVQVLARGLVDGLVARRHIDAVADLARALPLQVVPDLIGWPAGGRDHLLEWAGATFDWLGPMNERAERSLPAMQAMLQFADQTARAGDMDPGSVGAGLIDAGRRGDLEAERVAALIVGYLAPSLDTTISALGSAAWLLATHPGEWAALRVDPSLVPNAFNETLRVRPPIRCFTRVTTHDTDLSGVTLPRGSRILVLFGSANRDERHFTDPDRFDVRRANAWDHLGFGYGVHGCAGQSLARLEAHTLLGALVEGVERLDPDGSPSWASNNLIDAWASAPIRLTPA